MKCRWYVTHNTTALRFSCEGQCTPLIRGEAIVVLYCRVSACYNGMYEGAEGARNALCTAKIFQELFTVRRKRASGKQPRTGEFPGAVVFDPFH